MRFNEHTQNERSLDRRPIEILRDMSVFASFFRRGFCFILVVFIYFRSSPSALFSINLFGSGVEFGFYDFYLILGSNLRHSLSIRRLIKMTRKYDNNEFVWMEWMHNHCGVSFCRNHSFATIFQFS